MPRRMIGLTTNAGALQGSVAVANGGTGQTVAGQYGVMIARTGVAVPVTGTVAETIVFTGTIPAGLLSANGQFFVNAVASSGAGLTGTWTFNIRLGGIGGTSINSIAGLVSSIQLRTLSNTANRGATNSQISWTTWFQNATPQNSGNLTAAVDFTASVAVVATITLTATGDTVTFQAGNLIVYP